jgi:hypothetical protein
MTLNESKEHMNNEQKKQTGSSETRSGNPNIVDPNKNRSTEHKSGYGGEGGEPRESSDKTQKDEK